MKTENLRAERARSIKTGTNKPRDLQPPNKVRGGAKWRNRAEGIPIGNKKRKSDSGTRSTEMGSN